MRYFNKYLTILIILFFSTEKARTETIKEISNQLNDIKESISQLESTSKQEEYLIDKSLLEMTKSLDYINQNIDEGKIDVAISAINFTDKIIKDISSSVIPKDIQTEVVDKKIEYSPEKLGEIIEITNGMQVSKKENELNLAKDVIKIQNNGFSAFEIAENLKDNGINTIDVKNVIDLAILNKVAEPEILNEIINDAAKIYELNQKKSQLSNAILKSVSKEQAVGLLKSLNEGEEMEAVASQIVTSQSDTGISSLSVSEILNDMNKEKGAEILKSALDDIVDSKLVSIGRHRQYLKDWDVKIFSDGSREIIATPQELEEAAKEFKEGEQKRDLQNTIRKSMSGEEARQLLKSINQGNVPTSVAGLSLEVTESVAETAAEVTESISVEEITEALQEIVGNSTGELGITGVGRHRGLNSAGQLVDQVAIFRSDGSMEVCTETGDIDGVSSRGGC